MIASMTALALAAHVLAAQGASKFPGPPLAPPASLGPKDGWAALECRVTAERRVSNCKVAGEAPAGAGFGAKALAMADKLRLAPKSKEGKSVTGGTIRIPILFKGGQEPPSGAVAEQP